MQNDHEKLKAKTGFIHMVYFWAKEGATREELEKLRQGIHTLGGVETVLAMFIGSPAHTPRDVVDSSYAWSLLVLFNNKEEHDSYQDHPIHHAFVAECSHLWDHVQVYDSLHGK